MHATTASAKDFTDEKGKRFRSPLRYPGGKQKAVRQIAEMLPRRAREFREPMVGGGSVFFHARGLGLANRYWINDQFVELMAFWRAVKDPDVCRQLMQDLQNLHASFKSVAQIKRFYLHARSEEPSDPYRQALLFFFFNRVSFSGTTRAGGFSQSAALRRFTLSSIERLRDLPTALADALITEVDFQVPIEAPGEDVFLFLDPPYYTAHRLYGKNGVLHQFDHDRLASLLKKSRHRFLITYDDCPAVRSLYRWASITPWQLQYGMNNCNASNESKIGCELFIKNY